MKNIPIIIALFITITNCGAQANKTFNSIMRTTGSATMWDRYKPVMYGFAENPAVDISFPATTLIATEGDSVHIKAKNISQEHHTIHLHGLDVDMMNDGDPMTSFELDHQEKYTYRFKAKDAGTYLYHCHTADVVHVQMGMYGLVVIKPVDPMTAWTGGPKFEKEYSFLMSELDSTWHNKPPKHDPKNMTVMFPKYVPTYFLINGKSKQLFTDTILGKTGSNVYLRLANIGFYDNQVILPAELNASIIDSDGRPLPKARKRDTLNISPGERYGVMINSANAIAGNIKVNFVEMNTQTIKGYENIRYNINNTVGVEQLSENQQFSIYPNPANNIIYIATPHLIEGSISIFNSLGQQVKEQPIVSPTTECPINNLPKGIYMVAISNPNGTGVGKLKIVKQ